MIATLLVAWMGAAHAQEGARTFLHVENDSLTVSLAWETVDAPWLQDLGLDPGAIERLGAKADALEDAHVGAHRTLRVRAEDGARSVVTLERRPDTRWSPDEVSAWLTDCADADQDA